MPETAKDLMIAQHNNETDKASMMYIERDTTHSDITADGLRLRTDKRKLKRIVAQEELIELPSSEQILVRRPSCAPDDRPNRNPGRYERLLRDEPVKTYVPLLINPYVVD